MEKMIKHIIYRTTHKITGEYYIGLHKWNTTRPIHYWGTYWRHQPKSVRPYLVRETLAEYPDRESARRAEPHWIAPHLGDPLCMNSHAKELSERFDSCDKPGVWLGKKHKDETRNKIRAKVSESNSGENHPMWGKPAWNRGKKTSEETRKKLKESAKNRKASEIVTCPHCGESGKPRGMKRWHFDNCKKKQNKI